jgi:hypothetical protein
VRSRHRSTRAKAVARDYAKLYLGLRNYTQNLLRFGFSQADIAHGGTDRLIDATIPQGSAEQIAEVVRAHLDAGADPRLPAAAGRGGHPARFVDRPLEGLARLAKAAR